MIVFKYAFSSPGQAAGNFEKGSVSLKSKDRFHNLMVGSLSDYATCSNQKNRKEIPASGEFRLNSEVYLLCRALKALSPFDERLQKK
jgi:hypothetical protein